MPGDNNPNRTPLYRRPAADLESRVEDLRRRMTLEEKIAQMGMRHINDMIGNRPPSLRAMHTHLRGASPGCLVDMPASNRNSARNLEAFQKYCVEKTRLGIPAIFAGECLHGHQWPGATVFPQAIALAATWQPELVRKMAQATAAEARACGVTQALAPNLDLARDPRWGRVEETYGEDPYLVSRMGLAFIKGLQGDRPRLGRKHMIATVKHFAAHGSPEGGINLAPVAGGMHDLHTLYLPPFKAAITQGRALAVMTAYSEYDGIPATASKLLLTDILRDQWGFQGFVVSDCEAVRMLHTFHKTAPSPEAAARQALAAGLDMEEPEGYSFGERLLALVKKGRVPVAWIDRAVGNILRVKFAAGLFETPYADCRSQRVLNCPAHRRLARTIAQEAIILLKNNGPLLPLNPNLPRLAVIGPNADVAQLGDYCLAKDDAVTPLQGIQAAVSRQTSVTFAPGCRIFGQSKAGFAQAIAAARNSDAAIVIVGGSSTPPPGKVFGDLEALHTTCGESRDRSELDLPGVQDDLVQAVHETRTPTVVVLQHGRPNSITWIAEHVPAIVEAWYPGEEGGHALADILFGKVNPSGKLPVSVPRSAGHLPAFYNHKPSARGYYHSPGTPESPGKDYVFSSPAPLFAFGHGLSYTTFKYARLRVSPKKLSPAGSVTVTVAVTNTGKRAGKETVQLYLNDVYSSVTTPVRALKRFEKIALAPRARRTVQFVLTADDLALLDKEMNWRVEPGKFEVFAGPLKNSFTVVPPTAASPSPGTDQNQEMIP